MRDGFSISTIDDAIFKRINGRSYKKNCPLPLTELRYLRLLHKNLEGAILSGEMICNRAIAEALIDIFSRLFDAAYPIERMILIDDYDADDELSMRDNNSSCFNFRFVSHTNRISKHGYGLAVDINPLYNPYVTFVDGKKNIEPATAVAFEDRDNDFPYKIVKGDLCCRLFEEHGFGWGGDWVDCKDWQHFFVLGG